MSLGNKSVFYKSVTLLTNMNAFLSERHQTCRDTKEWESIERKLQSGKFVVIRGHKCRQSLLLFLVFCLTISWSTLFLKTWNSALLTSKFIYCTFQLVFHTDIACILVRSKVTYSSRRQTKAAKYHQDQDHQDQLMRCENIEITGKQFTFLLLPYMHRRWKGWWHTGKQTSDMFFFYSTEKCVFYYIFKHQG